MTYYMHETNNVNARRGAPDVIHAKSLRAAKSAASRLRFYRGTFLVLTNAVGAVVAIHDGTGWADKE
jgi:hypothetical protein